MPVGDRVIILRAVISLEISIVRFALQRHIPRFLDSCLPNLVQCNSCRLALVTNYYLVLVAVLSPDSICFAGSQMMISG
jgi:hypothetical protein